MRSPLARAALAQVAVLAVLGVAWLVPPTAVVLVWPLFLVVPGWAALALVRAPLDGAGRIGAGVVLSVAVSTHLVYWLSILAGGYGRAPIFAAAIVLAAPVPIAAWRGRRPHLRRPGRAAVALGLVAMSAALVVAGTLSVGMWQVAPDGIFAGGSNWSDLGVHLSIAETLNAGGNFPPQVPYFAGEPLVYHWFADFHAAILARASDMFSVPAMIVGSSVLAAALTLVVASLARSLVRGPDARRVALLAAVLAVFAGGFGWIRFLGDLSAGLGDPFQLVARNSYDNQWLTGWPYFRIPSVMGTGLLAHRATAAGLPILVTATLLLVAGLPSRRHRALGWWDRPVLVALAGLLGALLAPFHFFYAPVAPLLALAWAVTARRLLDLEAVRNVGAYLLPYLLALPWILAPALQAAGSGALTLVAGWPSAPREDGALAVVFFYATNLGLPFLFALVALLAAGLPHRAFLAAWVIGLFAVPNVVRLSVIDFDMNKYFQAMWIAVAILAAFLVRRWPAPAIAAVLLLSLPAPALVAGWTATSRYQVLTPTHAAAIGWVRTHTPPGSVFVTDGWVNSLTDAAGRLRLTTFPPYVANLGFRPDERVGHVVEMYCAGDPVRSAALMRRYGATYVVDAGRPQPCATPTDFGSHPAFALAYEDVGIRIWRLGD